MENGLTINQKSELRLEDRRLLTITGVLEVINFDEEKINLNTTLGTLQILGECLKINKIDVKNGDVSILGKVRAINYKTRPKKKKRNSILNILKKKIE